MATLRSVPAPSPDANRAEKILALLDAAYAKKQEIRALETSVDFFVYTADLPVIYLFTSHAPEAEYAFRLWASAKRFDVRPDPDEPKRLLVITDVGVIASVLDDEDDTRVVDVDETNPLFI